MSPASLGIICFRRAGAAGEDETTIARHNAALVAAFERTGAGLVSSTRLRGRYAIRLCVMNHTTAAEHVRGVLDWFAQAPEPAAVRAQPASPARSARVTSDHWLSASAFTAAELRAVPLLGSLDDRELEQLAGWARELRVPAGEPVTRRWQAARDFFIVIEGRIRVERDGELLAELGAGEFFGEIGALDWGAGYGYPRQATVLSTEPLRLLVLAPAHLSRLMAVAPAVDVWVRRAAGERLALLAD
jgi:hypothetical protein